MGAADVVPGVSGGTIALLLGIYERLIDSVSAASTAAERLLRGDLTGFRQWLGRVEWGFVLPLLGGILLAIAALASALETLLEDHPIQMAGLFTGLIGGTVVAVWGMLGTRDATRTALAIGAAIVTFVVLGLRDGATEETVSQTADPALLAFFGSGAIAICAMILPGVSGSFLLVLLGMYSAVIGAVDDRELGTLVVFAAGCAVGLGVFSRLLHWLLHNHHDSLLAVLIGLMAGSIRILWPWPDGLESTELGSPEGFVAEALLLAVAAAVIVVVLSALGRRRPSG